MTTINAAEAVALLQRAVDKRGPDYVYVHPKKVVTDLGDPEWTTEMQGCWYELNGAPSCGVGLALSYKGVPTEVLDTMDQASDDTSIQAVDYILRDHGFYLTHEAIGVFSKFQESQDLETPWGEALNAAKEAVK